MFSHPFSSNSPQRKLEQSDDETLQPESLHEAKNDIFKSPEAKAQFRILSSGEESKSSSNRSTHNKYLGRRRDKMQMRDQYEEEKV
jgi:hypothetical protein